MPGQYTAIVRKSKLEYVAVCLELNVSARGVLRCLSPIPLWMLGFKY